MLSDADILSPEIESCLFWADAAILTQTDTVFVRLGALGGGLIASRAVLTTLAKYAVTFYKMAEPKGDNQR